MRTGFPVEPSLSSRAKRLASRGTKSKTVLPRMSFGVLAIKSGQGSITSQEAAFRIFEPSRVGDVVQNGPLKALGDLEIFLGAFTLGDVLLHADEQGLAAEIEGADAGFGSEEGTIFSPVQVLAIPQPVRPGGTGDLLVEARAFFGGQALRREMSLPFKAPG